MQSLAPTLCGTPRQVIFAMPTTTRQRPPRCVCSAEQNAPDLLDCDRRRALVSLASCVGVAALAPGALAPRADAIQGLTAGRIPGITGPDADGFFTYARPEGKSGD